MNLEQIAQDVQQLTQGKTVAIALAESDGAIMYYAAPQRSVAWFKKGQFWVIKAGQIQALSVNSLKNKCIKIQANLSGALKSLKAQQIQPMGMYLPVINSAGLLPTLSKLRLPSNSR